MLKNIFNPHLPLHFGYRNKKEEAKTEAMCQYDNVPISLRSPVESQKSKVESSRVSIYSEHETQNLNSKSRNLSGQIIQLITEPETRN